MHCPRMVWVGLWIFQSLLSRPCQAEETKDFKIPPPDSYLSTLVTAKYHFSLGIDLLSGIQISKMFGGALTFAYQGEYLFFDLRGYGGLTNYGSVAPNAGPSDSMDLANDRFPNGLTSEYELVRTRSSDDRWFYMYGQPGIGVRARLFPNSLPLFTQKARVGFGFGRWSDLANGLSFSSFIYNYEGSFEYQFSKKSPVSMHLTFGHNGGWMVATTAETVLKGRLPISWTWFGLGLDIWF
jgi:hypothetical protein